MRVRVVAAVLLAATAILYAGLTLPLQRKAAAAAEAYRRARDERREARSRLGEMQRRESALRRAAPARVAGTPSDAVGLTRHGIIQSLGAAGLSGVRLAVRPGKPPAAAAVRLSAEGPFPEIVRLTGDVVRPGTGVVLERFQLSARDSRVAMSLEGVGLEARP